MIALYSRVSTDRQQTENQKIRLIEFAEKNNFPYHLYDEVESTRNTRPVKQQMLMKARAGEYEAIVVFKLDRFARSFTELMLDVNKMVNKGVGFISLSENHDFTTASGKLQFQILSAFAEFEREIIRDRTIEGLRRAKIKGKKLGRPFGSKDSKPRRRSGYILREAMKKKVRDQENGNFKGIEDYLDS